MSHLYNTVILFRRATAYGMNVVMRKQMRVVSKQLARDDIAEVVNACDAGREGELIFAYLYEKAKAKTPVRRLWLNSMTNAAMKEALAALRPGSEFALLEAAARSRSEADWIVGMNATRAATIRLRSSFDGAVSLGRVQTPTLAIVARREEEIRAFVPEPYWLVDATFLAGEDRRYEGRFHTGTGEAKELRGPRLATEQQALEVVAALGGPADAADGEPVVRPPGQITKVEKKEQREKAPMLYDLTTLQREANNRYGFSARRTLAAAQRCYEEHKALTYPRTSSRYLPSDMISEIKPVAELVGTKPEYRKAAQYVTGLDLLPLARVVNDAKVTDHHAIIPTRAEHALEKMGADDRRIYDMVARRFLAVFHPDAVFENTRVETTVSVPDEREQAGYVFRTRGKLMLVPGWRGVYEEVAEEAQARSDEDEAPPEQRLPRLDQDERVAIETVASARKETKPPRRYSDASLLAAMETAGKLVDDDELREAMKDSGIGTPATRSAIIERLIQVGYLERDGRALVATEKGLNVIRLLNHHALTSPGLTGDWEHRLGKIERGEDSRKRFMSDIAGFAQETVKELDETLKGVRIPRARLGPCPVCGHEIVENRKGYSCWAREDPGCGFVIWKSKAGKTLPVAVARELIKQGYTTRPVTGFRGRSGRTFRARLALGQTEEGKWRVEFDEEWAREGAKPPEADAEGGGELAQAQADSVKRAAIGQRSAA